MDMIIADRPPTRTLLDLNPMSGDAKAGPRRFWTTREIAIIRENYPVIGLPGCIPLLPGRSAHSIYLKANNLHLIAPSQKAQRAGLPRKKHVSNEHIDKTIREKYPLCTTRGSVTRLALSMGLSRWWVSKRAVQLGLVLPRFKEPTWDAKEIEIIQSRSHLSDIMLQRALKGAGFKRSVTGIKLKLRRLGADRSDPDHYTGCQLAQLMGVDNKTPSLWIAKGLLAATKRGTQRVEAQGGDQWWISRRAVRTFIVRHTFHVDIRKVDKFWFVNLLAGPYAET